MPTPKSRNTEFDYINFANALRTALLLAKAQSHIDDSHAVHVLDNGSELCLFWTSSGITLASWIGYKDDKQAATQLRDLLKAVEASPGNTVNTFNNFMINAAMLPAGDTTLADYVRPIYAMVVGGHSEAPLTEVHFVGCNLLDPCSPVDTVLISNRYPGIAA